MQLFFEMDESMSVPTINDLLKRMFHEQQISFTEVCVALGSDHMQHLSDTIYSGCMYS